MIAAIDKAQCLARHAKYLGCRPSEFVVSLSMVEAFELLDYMAEGHMGTFQNHEQFLEDLREARYASDPWEMLDGFTLMGIAIMPASELH